MDTETEYYMRIILLIFKAGTMTCRGIIKRELTSVTLDQILQPHEPKLKHKLLKAQCLLLFPKQGQADPEDFDLSLLLVVLLDVLNLPPDERQEIESLKEMRNKIIHDRKVSLDKVSYTAMKTTLENSLSKLSKGLQAEIQKECTEMIHKFLTEPLDETAALQYVHGIRNDEEILQRVHEMLEEQTWTFVKEINKLENRMETKFENMKHDQETVFDKMIKTMKECHEKNESRKDAEKCDTTSSALCEKCLEDYISSTATIYCHSCSQFLCHDCYQSTHVKSLFLSMKNHHLQNAGDAAKKEVNMKGMDMCNVHSVHYTCYCKKHEELCCDKCLPEKHHGCRNIVDIKKIAISSANFMLDPVAEIKRLHDDTISMEEWIASFEKKLNTQLQELPSILQEKKTRLIELFDKKARMLATEAEMIHGEKMSQIQKNRSQCKEIIDNTEQTKRSMIRIAANGTTDQKFIAYRRLNDQIKTFQDSFARIREMYENSPGLVDIKSFEENV